MRISGSVITSSLAFRHELLSNICRSTQRVRVETSAITDASTMSVQIETRRHRPSFGGAAGVVL